MSIFIWDMVLLGVIFYLEPPKWVAWLIVALGLCLSSYLYISEPFALLLCHGVLLMGMLIFTLPFIRMRMTRLIHVRVAKTIPTISETEREALEAGTVGFESELFTGRPNFSRLDLLNHIQLTDEEQSFLNNEVNALLALTNDWQISHEKMDLPKEIWDFLKQKGFFGLEIPKEFGGKGFSSFAHAQILSKLAARSVTLSSTVSVPNSLGPAELFLHYGTDTQKNYYLPRLARGEEIPCFALTSPDAGSDAGSIPDVGIVVERMVNGENQLGLVLTWKKRYITLAPIATLLGLAVKVYDPQHLLGEKTECGITCVIVPVNTPGVQIGNRHFPLNIPFQNGPTEGHEVFVPIDAVIGGAAGIGNGWHMLVECLSTGRAISLPSGAAGSAMMAACLTGAYSHMRIQFNQPISRFEGVQEVLARMLGFCSILEAGRILTIKAIVSGQKPSVLGAVMKYHATEMARKISADAMDIQGGKGIMLGPHNLLGRGYQSTPIAITVEGANILTRNLIVFGQGLLRAHPFLLKELESIHTDFKIFDAVLWQHVFHNISLALRAFLFKWLSFLECPVVSSYRCVQKRVTRLSTLFAFLSEIAIVRFGGKLKFKETLSARLGDVMSYLYLTSCLFSYYEHENMSVQAKPLLKWSLLYLRSEIQHAFEDILSELRLGIFTPIIRFLWLPCYKSRAHSPLNHEVAQLLSSNSMVRDHLFSNIAPECIPGQIHAQCMEAFVEWQKVEEDYFKVQKLLRLSETPWLKWTEQLQFLVDEGHITILTQQALLRAEVLRQAVIAVDSFDPHLKMSVSS